MKTCKVFAMAAAALVLGLTSCSKENSSIQTAERYKVTLSFGSATTRADGALAEAGDVVVINDGYICFVSANDAITKVYTISSDPTGGTNIENDDLGATPVTLSDVPGTSTKVYMVANTGAIANLSAPVEGATMTSYMTNIMDVRDQGLHTAVTSVGNASLQPGATSDTRVATITLSTSVSRIQLKGITFEGDIEGIVAGIFVNGYYPTMPLNGTAVSGTWVTSNDALMYDQENGSTIFPSALETFVYDEVDMNFHTDDVTGKAIVVPTTTNGVWGYNLFTSATPQVIIKLTDVVVGGQALVDDQFITINGFKNSTNGATIGTIAGGMIYTISTSNLVVKFENMSIEPGVTPIEVDVTVIPVTWQETEVIPVI